MHSALSSISTSAAARHGSISASRRLGIATGNRQLGAAPSFSWRKQRTANALSTSSFHLGGTRLSPDDEEDRRREGNNLSSLRRHYYQPVRVGAASNSDSNSISSSRRLYHTTASPERGAVSLILGFGALSAVSFAASNGVTAYKEWKAAQPIVEEKEETEAEPKEKALPKDDASAAGAAAGKRENIFSSWFGVGVGSKYYEGGFEDEMTRSEAALILGVRESSTSKRIKDAHRKLLILNHPDTGGSTYMAGKINEAKELLLKGRRG